MKYAATHIQISPGRTWSTLVCFFRLFLIFFDSVIYTPLHGACSGPVADPWMAWLCSGPFTDNPPHAKSPVVHNTDRILDSIILLIQISYLPVWAIHEFSLQ